VENRIWGDGNGTGWCEKPTTPLRSRPRRAKTDRAAHRLQTAPTIRATTSTCKRRPYLLSLPGEAKPVFSSLLLITSHSASHVCSAAPCAVHHCRRAAGSSAIKLLYSCANLAVDQSFIREPSCCTTGSGRSPTIYH
jgi:hypothetical protein